MLQSNIFGSAKILLNRKKYATLHLNMTDDVYARIKSKKDRHALRAKDYIAEASLFICAHESEKKSGFGWKIQHKFKFNPYGRKMKPTALE